MVNIITIFLYLAGVAGIILIIRYKKRIKILNAKIKEMEYQAKVWRMTK